jgi:hypothetical protein
MSWSVSFDSHEVKVLHRAVGGLYSVELLHDIYLTQLIPWPHIHQFSYLIDWTAEDIMSAVKLTRVLNASLTSRLP